MNRRITTLASDKRGATAVEFALIAAPFIWLLIGLVELALYFASASLMSEASNVGARLIRTGQIAQAADPEQAFIDAVCNRAAVFIPCEDIQYEVRHIADDQFLNAADYAEAFDDDGNLNSQGFDAGSQSSVIIVRIAYRYPFLTPLIGNALGQDGTNTRLILNTIVMKSEPYDFNA